ncbi:PilW family protein [Hyalangium sp.]|uniref:PilW family protein n=1 Tax=Hyalangium sp. TaxID=2028555 RepID=UPI002D3C0F3A|nr:prepilin-type N-terminal cleavage/methylation domain-containing protein [Hyalangium sp.]HYH94322.1 prepilin-type N-terminal cleavage/methylation domain-containing protein [Hyalangium sp.]
MRKSFRSRGFTLLELLVGAAVGAVVMAGISLTFISQARQYQSHASRRGVQANARQALAFMGRHLRSAGYGVNPDRAILSWDSYDAANEQQAPGFPDAFVVHFRDGLFRRDAQAVASNLITLSPLQPLTEDMRRGQILLVVCVRSPNFIDPSVDENPPHRFVTVGQYVPAGAVAIPLDQNPVLPLEDRPTRRPGRLFHEETVPGFAHPCFGRAPPQVMKVTRAAFYVAMFTNPNNNERKPYLMMHQGLDMPTAGNLQGDGVIDAADAVPVAEGIEQLQVAYVLNTLNTTPPTPPINNNVPIILGVTDPMGPAHFGEAWEQINPAVLPSGWFFNPIPIGVAATANDPRVLDHPANIRQVRMTLVARSSLPDPQIVGDDFLLKPNGTAYPNGAPLPGGTIPWRHLENLDMPPTPDFTPAGNSFYRILLRESITPKNLLLNRQFAPSTPGGG